MRIVLPAIVLAALTASPPSLAAYHGLRPDGQNGSEVAPARLARYSEALFEVLALRRKFQSQRLALPSSELPLLQQQLARDTSAALERAQLNPAEFNTITKQVEHDPALRQRLKHRMMKKVIGV